MLNPVELLPIPASLLAIGILVFIALQLLGEPPAEPAAPPVIVLGRIVDDEPTAELMPFDPLRSPLSDVELYLKAIGVAERRASILEIEAPTLAAAQ